MADDHVKLYGVEVSPFVSRVITAFNLKGIKYEFIQEHLTNKSADLLKYNPVHKSVPVLVHNGCPISESLVIVEYIDDVCKGLQILPQDPYEKAQARFWARFIADKLRFYGISSANRHYSRLLAAMERSIEQVVAEAHDQLQFLENELNVKGKKFFGGNSINLVDICASYIAFWVGAAEEALGIQLVTKDKFPKIIEWSHNYINCQVVKESLPPRESLVAYYKLQFGKA